MSQRVAIIGAGAMGLACAHRLLQSGRQVVIFEADDRIGGMSAHFDFNGLPIERFYHFVCRPDRSLMDYLDELGLGDRLKWRDTKMGYFHNGALLPWGDPLSLLKFPNLNLWSKLRYGLHMFLSTKRHDWSHLESMEASEWLINGCGREAYEVLWRKLFELKFFQYSGNLSAAWIWTRIKRVGLSRRSVFQESLGYIEGGSETFLRHLAEVIQNLGGEIHLNQRVDSVLTRDGQVTGIRVDNQDLTFDAVISTVPLPYVPDMVPDLPKAVLQQYRALDNIGVVCVLFKLRQPVTGNFWLNINDPEIEIPGIIEYSNLRPLKNSIVYVPFYLPTDHPKWNRSNQAFIEESKACLARINPKMGAAMIVDVHVSRYRYAQPICPPGFLDALPPIRTVIGNLLIADTAHYYPEDRSISESVRLGQALAAML